MLQTLIDFLNTSMKIPRLYEAFKHSWFHYVSLLLMVLGIIMVTKLMHRADDQKLKKFLLMSAFIMILFELYKQFIFTYQAGSYPWYIFPFQFCSTPMYILLISGLTKNEKLNHALLSFLATFGMFAGLAVMLYPATVFVSTAGINAQTMVHHGMMAIIGVGLSIRLIERKSLYMFSAILVFATLLGTAILLNTIYNTWIDQGTFNMFFINPLYENGIPVLSIFQPLVSDEVFVLIYLFGFSFVAFIMSILSRVGYQLYIHFKAKEKVHVTLKKRRAAS